MKLTRTYTYAGGPYYSTREAMERLGYSGENMENLFIKATQYTQRRLFALDKARAERLSDEDHLATLSGAFRTMATSLAEQYYSDAVNAKQPIRSVTLINSQGIPSPTLSEILADVMKLDRRTTPFYHITGVNCGGNVLALQHLYNLRRDSPHREGERDLLFTIEVPSVTLRRTRPVQQDFLFFISDVIISDGGALAVLESTKERKGLEFFDHLSLMFPKLAPHLPSRFDGEQIQYGVNPKFTDEAGKAIRVMVDRALEKTGLTQEQVRRWIIHPGGVAIVQALKNTLGLGDDNPDVINGIETIRTQGNTMSSLLLYNLHSYFQRGVFTDGDVVMLMGIAPGIEIETLATRYE